MPIGHPRNSIHIFVKSDHPAATETASAVPQRFFFIFSYKLPKYANKADHRNKHTHTHFAPDHMGDESTTRPSASTHILRSNDIIREA